MPVYSAHRKYPDALLQWTRCRDAASGSDAVKAKGIAYLPLLEGHTSFVGSPYIGYKARALFYPAMGRTVNGLAGLVFGKPPTVKDIPATYSDEFEDVTLTGVSLPAYALELCIEALTTGRVGTLIDMPELPASTSSNEDGDEDEPADPEYDGAGADTLTPGARPYWVTYSAENVINWKVERMPDGVRRLTLVVLSEEKETPNPKDDFEPIVIRQFRVLELVNGVYSVTIWRENEAKKGTWDPASTVVPVRRGQPLDYIPFAFLGPSGTDAGIDHPPLLDLVDVNLSHYRTSADQEHGAHFTALPTPYVTGHTVPAGETLAIGSGTAWILPNPNAGAGMVEFTGAGLGALQTIKEEKRQLMATLGARMLETQKNTQEAASTVRLRHAGERSALSVLADALGQHLTTVLRWHLFWDGMEPTAAAKAAIKLNPDVMDELSADDMRALVTTWQAGAISHKTLYHNLQWGEWTRPKVDFEEELQDIEDEAPDPGLDLPPDLAVELIADPSGKNPGDPGYVETKAPQPQAPGPGPRPGQPRPPQRGLPPAANRFK